jgi:2-haloacid dehalogenase
VVFLTISRSNGCEYCVSAHSMLAEAKSKVPPAVIDAIRDDQPLPDPKLAALAAFTRVMVTARGLPTRAQVEAFLTAGYSEPQILEIVLAIAGIAELFDAILSVEEVGVYKPHPSVYGLAVDRLRVRARDACFLSSNSWDAYSAKAFGYRVLWCNRFSQAAERIPATPDGELRDLSALPERVLA